MQRMTNLAAAFAAALTLSACLISDAPLFTAQNARATPLAPGAYDACDEPVSADLPPCKEMTVSHNEQGLYRLTVADEDGATLARFKAVGANLWAAQMWEAGDESYHYFVATKHQDRFLLSMIACEKLPKALRDRFAASGDMEVDADASTCRVKTVKAVIAATKAYYATDGSMHEHMALIPVE